MFQTFWQYLIGQTLLYVFAGCLAGGLFTLAVTGIVGGGAAPRRRHALRASMVVLLIVPSAVVMFAATPDGKLFGFDTMFLGAGIVSLPIGGYLAWRLMEGRSAMPPQAPDP